MDIDLGGWHHDYDCDYVDYDYVDYDYDYIYVHSLHQPQLERVRLRRLACKASSDVQLGPGKQADMGGQRENDVVLLVQYVRCRRRFAGDLGEDI